MCRGHIPEQRGQARPRFDAPHADGAVGRPRHHLDAVKLEAADRAVVPLERPQRLRVGAHVPDPSTVIGAPATRADRGQPPFRARPTLRFFRLSSLPNGVVGRAGDDAGVVELEARDVRGVALKGADRAAAFGPVAVQTPQAQVRLLPRAMLLARPLHNGLPVVRRDPPRKVAVQRLLPDAVVAREPPPQTADLDGGREMERAS